MRTVSSHARKQISAACPDHARSRRTAPTRPSTLDKESRRATVEHLRVRAVAMALQSLICGLDRLANTWRTSDPRDSSPQVRACMTGVCKTVGLQQDDSRGGYSGHPAAPPRSITASIRQEDNLRFTRGTLPGSASAACADATRECHHCTQNCGVSRPPVPRPVPRNVTPWTYRVIVSEYTLAEGPSPRRRYEVTVTMPRSPGVDALLPPGGQVAVELAAATIAAEKLLTAWTCMQSVVSMIVDLPSMADALVAGARVARALGSGDGLASVTAQPVTTVHEAD